MYKRMIDTDFFYGKSFTTLDRDSQMAYVALLTRADDYGFVEDPDWDLEAFGIGKGAIKELVDKGLLYRFEDNVYLIRHWNIHYKRNPKWLIYSEHKADLDKVYLADDKTYVLKVPQEEYADGVEADIAVGPQVRHITAFMALTPRQAKLAAFIMDMPHSAVAAIPGSFCMPFGLAKANGLYTQADLFYIDMKVLVHHGFIKKLDTKGEHNQSMYVMSDEWETKEDFV